MKVTPEIENLTEICKDHSSLDLSLYKKYDVKRGLRDLNGKGVLAGLTQVSNVCAVKVVDGREVPCAGSLSFFFILHLLICFRISAYNQYTTKVGGCGSFI